LHRIAPLAVALLLDARCGEPPARLHPVVWMGRVLDWLKRPHRVASPLALAYGLGVALGLPLVWGCVGWLVERALPWPLQALVLKPAFADRALLDASRASRQR
jgi:adenosylcobinamide-phosphate synthase